MQNNKTLKSFFSETKISKKYSYSECLEIINYAKSHNINLDNTLQKLKIPLNYKNFYLEDIKLSMEIVNILNLKPDYLKSFAFCLEHQGNLQELSDLIITHRLNTNQAYESCQIIHNLRLINNKGKELLSLLTSELTSDNFLLALRLLSQPEIESLRKELSSLFKNIKSKNVTINYNDNFESNELILNLHLKSKKDLEQTLKHLNQNQNKLIKLLNLIEKGSINEK